MNSLSDLSSLPIWQAIALAIGFPLGLLFLNELIGALERRSNPLAKNLRILRNLVLPALAALLFANWILGLPNEHNGMRWIETIFWVTLLYALLGFVNDIVFGMGSKKSLGERVPKLFRDLAQALLVAIGAMVIYSKVWGMEIQGALTALGLGSIVIGLALQEPLGNIVSGLMLLLERPLNVGDWVTVDGVTGKVTEINWRSVHIETPTREIRVVPNVSLYKGAFSNLSRPTPERTEIVEMGFSYDDPPSKVKELLMDLLLSTPGVKSDPAPLVRTVNYADFSIIYRMIFTVEKQETLGSTRDEMMTRLWYMARREGLTIPFPIQMEYKPGENPGKPQKTTSQWLNEQPRFKASLKPADVADLQILEYTAGEIMHSPAKPFEGGALILKGDVLLLFPSHEGQELVVSKLGAGECFGDNLTAGSSSDAITLKASNDVTVLWLPTQQMDELLSRSSNLSSEVGDAIELRRLAVQAIKRHRKGQSLPAN
ncbi:MAG: mechanosensitive ion channel domain-containing protein [Planctomycetota bacterium]|jgi:small-conductance mechanosensitive channel